MNKKILVPGTRVKIIGGAPYTRGIFMEDVGKEGVIGTIIDIGWGDKNLGKYGYEVIPDGDGCIFGLYYPESALEVLENDK